MKAETAMPLFVNDETAVRPLSARDLYVVEIGMELALEFNARWHSMLPRNNKRLLGAMLCGNMSVAYAAEYRGMFYAVAIWSQPIIASLCDGHTIELRRMAVCGEAPKYTASRMLSVMRRLVPRKYPSLFKAISYLAVDVHVGTMYRADGWTPVGEIVDARPQRFSGSNQRATGPLQTKSRKQRWEVSL